MVAYAMASSLAAIAFYLVFECITLPPLVCEFKVADEPAVLRQTMPADTLASSQSALQVLPREDKLAACLLGGES